MLEGLLRLFSARPRLEILRDAFDVLLVAFAIYNGRVWRWTARDDGPLDERDRVILAAAPAGQAPAMIVTLAAWTIALTETYRSTQLIPSVFLYLIFWSLLMVSVLGLLAGVVMGYRRS